MHRLPLVLLSFLFVLTTACGDDGAGETTTTTPAPTTTTPTTTLVSTTTTMGEATTVTTYPAAYASPLNGLPAEDARFLDRRIVGVKIDNHPLARPQGGLDQADAVIETVVEALLTRFIALYHDNDSDYVGPIRSLRPTDTALMGPLDLALAISGGQPWVQNLAVERGVRLVGESEGFFRVGSRSAPHNLFTSTLAVRQTADNRGYPDVTTQGLFQIGEWPIPDATATEIVLEWTDQTTVRWEWDEAAQAYTRWIGTNPHEWVRKDNTRGQITAQVLIVISGTQYVAYPPGGNGTAVPAIETQGYGPALIFAVGRVWEGQWHRDSLSSPYRLTELDGTPVVVPTGVPWISVFPNHRTISYQ